MEWLKSVEYEVAHVFVHVGLHHPAIKVIDHTTTVHHLWNKRGSDRELKQPRERISSPRGETPIQKRTGVLVLP